MKSTKDNNRQQELLTIKSFGLQLEEKNILNNLNLKIKRGSVHVIMGPNGSGKSTLALAIAGHPNFTSTTGQIKFKNKDLLKKSPEERAQEGIFLSFQNPPTIPGVTVSSVLRSSLNHLKKARGEPTFDIGQFYKTIRPILDQLKVSQQILARQFNDGFSGGERKKLEVIQYMLLKPTLAIFDEIDSGLDVDALKMIARGILAAKSKKDSLLLITHYSRILKLFPVDQVHILKNGKIVKSGSKNLAFEIERVGYQLKKDE